MNFMILLDCVMLFNDKVFSNNSNQSQISEITTWPLMRKGHGNRTRVYHLRVVVHPCLLLSCGHKMGETFTRNPTLWLPLIVWK